MKPILIVVDMQNDFYQPNGALAVAHADVILPGILRVCAAFEEREFPIIFTKDYHPINHISFHAQGGEWPPHCIKNTKGAALIDELTPWLMYDHTSIVLKGQKPDVEEYSGMTPRTLDICRAYERDTVIICGLAFDYCVRETALAARVFNYKTAILTNATKSVDPANAAGIIKELREKGVKFC